MAQVDIKHPEKFSGLMGEHFNNPEYCGVRVIADDGAQFHCAEYVLRCGSEVFHKMLSHNMQEKISGEIHIKDATSDTIRIMLSFMHTGSCTLDSTNLLPVMSIALRYQVHHLISACEEYRQEHFLVNEDNWFCNLNQIYVFCAVPQELRKQCQHVALSNLARFPRNKCVHEQFLQLPYQLVEDIAKAALHHIFLSESFPSGYVNFSLTLLEWLDYGIESRSSKALGLLSCLRFDALGFEGIATICDREPSQTNWVRKHSKLEQRILNALPQIRKTPICCTNSQSFTCAPGRWSFVCKAEGSKATKATFDFKESVQLHTCSPSIGGTSNHGYGYTLQEYGFRGCAIYTECSCRLLHTLLASGHGIENALLNQEYNSRSCYSDCRVSKEPCVFGCDARRNQETRRPNARAGHTSTVNSTVVHSLAIAVERAQNVSHENYIGVLEEPSISAGDSLQTSPLI